MAQKPDVIFVGNKPPMSYVLAIITAFSQGNLKETTLKARGQAITTAVVSPSPSGFLIPSSLLATLNRLLNDVTIASRPRLPTIQQRNWIVQA